jgi:hypothetical protein
MQLFEINRIKINYCVLRCVMVIEYWNFEFIWDLRFVIWDLNNSIQENEVLLNQPGVYRLHTRN